MSLVKNIKIGNVSYTIRDANTDRSLSEAQKTEALNEGTYDGVAIENGEVFTEYGGKFVEFKNEPTEGKPPVQVTQPIAGSVFGHGGRVIIWSRSGTTGYYSDDSGSTWNTFTMPFSEATRFAHNGSLWMAATSFYTATSSDGITWTQGANFPSQYASYLGCFNGKFYTYYQSSFWYTEDGSSWTQGVSPVSGEIVLLCRDEDILIFSAGGDIYKSTDGASWESLGVSLGTSDYYQVYAKAYYVLGKTVLYHSFGGSLAAKYSTNLTDWTTISSQPYDSTSIVEVNDSLAISTNGSSTSKSEFYKTTDGISWTTVTTPSSFTYNRAAATSDGTFYVFQQRSTTGFIGKAGTSYSLIDLSYNKAEVDAAIVEAAPNLTGYLKNTATGSNNLNVLGTVSSSYTDQTVIGYGAVSSVPQSVSLGSNAKAYSMGGVTAVGYRAYAYGGTAIGSDAKSMNGSIAVGFNANTGSTTLGTYACNHSLAIGIHALAGTDTYDSDKSANAIAIGNGAIANGQNAIAIGQSKNWSISFVQAKADYAIQIGPGANIRANTMNIGLSDTLNVRLLDANGQIPGERMSLQGTTAPDTTTVGSIGQFYVDTTTGTGYMCVGADTVTPAYTWKQITA